MAHTSVAWLELYDDLRSRIRSGELRAEEAIEQPGIAPHAADDDYIRAVERLIDEGLLRRAPLGEVSVGTVRARSRRNASFSSDYSAQGRVPSIRTVTLALCPLEDAPLVVQNTLVGTGTSMLIRHYHVQSVDGIPHALADSYIPYHLVSKKWQEIKTRGFDTFALLSEVGITVTEKQETLYVDSPNYSERDLLGILTMPGLPVVRLDCVVWSGAQVVEVCLLCDRSDLYEFNYRVDLRIA